jgi:hypothetical protein
MSKDENRFAISKNEDITTQMTKFIIKRHKIFLKRNLLKQPKPWTQDPILQQNRFCNIYRELDTVSLWIRKHIIQKYEKDPNLWFMLCIARIINWPPTLQMLMDEGCWPTGDSWSAQKTYKALAKWYESGNKTITGAYLINSVLPKGIDAPDRRKVWYIPHIALDRMWKDRHTIEKAFKSSLEDSVNTLKMYHGWAAFMSYQVTVDLTYSNKWLGKATDLNTFNAQGPGTVRGLNRYFTGAPKPTLKKSELLPCLIRQRDEVNAKLRELVLKKWWTDDFNTGFAEVSLANQSNTNCEFDKFCRLYHGQGQMRAKYPGGANQIELF